MEPEEWKMKPQGVIFPSSVYIRANKDRSPLFFFKKTPFCNTSVFKHDFSPRYHR